MVVLPDIDMNEPYLRFWGVRGSYSAPFSSHLKVGGNTSCVEIRVDNHILVCDAGTGIIPFGNELLEQNDIRELMILLTHYHWDHVCGLPFFSPAFSSDWHLRFFGPGRDPREIERHVSAQMQAPYFPVSTEIWTAGIDYMTAAGNRLDYGPFRISYQNVHHPGITYGYRINIGGKTLVYISDNECLFLNKSIEQRYGEFNPEEQQLYSTMQREEYNSALQFMQGADILIHDAQYTPADYEKKRGWGHSCYIDTVNSAIDAGVKQLYLYHHDPNYNDEQIALIHQDALRIIHERGTGMECHIAREGLQVSLA